MLCNSVRKNTFGVGLGTVSKPKNTIVGFVIFSRPRATNASQNVPSEMESDTREMGMLM